MHKNGLLSTDCAGANTAGLRHGVHNHSALLLHGAAPACVAGWAFLFLIQSSLPFCLHLESFNVALPWSTSVVMMFAGMHVSVLFEGLATYITCRTAEI